jgi:aldehyde:ferredoxin oxidoreductase
MFDGGYTGKILRINLSAKKYQIEPLKENEVLKLLGGRGLAAKSYYDEIAPQIKSFDPDNKIFFFTGPLTGVALPSTTKFQLSTKSPETGRYLCSNCGGNFGPQLKTAGYDALIIEGRAEEWTYITIKNETVTFGDAAEWQGKSTTDTLDLLHEAIGEKTAGVLSIGPAAERLVRISYINVDTRAFGRGGAGAVLGSKRLKGIAVFGSNKIPVADKEEINQIRKAAIENLRNTRANHTKYGTAQYIEVINELGAMPTRNFQTTHFEGGRNLDAQTMRQQYYVKNYACFRCPVACGKMLEVKDGPFAGAKARAEFETIGLFGPNCGIDDYGAVIKANQLCDELGLDTISAGHAVALVMELYERNLITARETEGIEARFGSAQALIDIIKLIGERRGIGDLLAEGMNHVLRIHPEWSPYIIAVKGMPFAAYDPRAFHGNGLTYGTSSRGACHNVGGWTIRAELQSGDYDRYALEGKGKLVKSIQDNRAYVDSLGICTVVRSSMGYSDTPDSDVLKAATGHDFTPRLMEIGARIYTLERLILNREGVTRLDDRLPERISTQPIPSGPAKGHVLTAEMYDIMLNEYYAQRGWDQNGVPTSDTVEKLGIAELVNLQ